VEDELPANAALPSVLGDTERQSAVLESLTSAVNYNDWLVSLAVPHLGDSPVELGSGLGDYAQAWLDKGIPRITTSEVDPARLSRLHTRFADDPRVEVTSFDVVNPPRADHSALVAINVFEHISDHIGAMRGARTLLRPGGLIVLFVPAFSFAMSRFDRQIGHVRRYTVPGMRGAMAEAGLEVVDARYVNLPGLAAWFVGMRLLRMSPGEGRLLSIWDRTVVPAARMWESGHRIPFGQSVFAVGRVPQSP
jgi:hypothetical protein